MKEPRPTTDDALERVLAWRADRAAPTGLLDEIHERLAMEPQPRSYRVFGVLPQAGRLAWLIALLAIVAALVVGASLVGGRPDRALLSNLSSPAASPTARLRLADCTASRAVSAAPLDLTGTWRDRAGIFYLRQVGTELWGVQRYRLGADVTDNAALTGQPWTVLHGTVGPGSTIAIDWADAGATGPADPAGQSGSVTFSAGPRDGTVELTSTSQTGDRMSGPSYDTETLDPCTPSVTLVP